MPKFQLSKSTPLLPRTYWVVDRIFLAGAYAGNAEPRAHRERLRGLVDAGVRTFVNLMEEDETNNVGKPFVRYDDVLVEIAAECNAQIECLRFPIVDVNVTTNEHMKEILDAIDRSIDNNRPVYVHCFGGIGRTGTVVCCWLLRHGYATKVDVFDVLGKLRRADTERASRPAPENEIQREFVRDWREVSAQTNRKVGTTVASKDDWFTKLTGFSERSPQEVRDHISINEGQLTSHVNGATYQCGKLEIVSLGVLRERLEAIDGLAGKLKISELVGDAKALHTDPANAGALFQVASQFNLLEMASPNNIPEQGIGIYERDPTQGPACAVACGAGTIYRNYFVEFDGQIGQSESKQVDCLSDIGRVFGNENYRLWKMLNGYALPTADGLKKVIDTIGSMSESELESTRDQLQIGVQWNTQVTLDGCNHCVTQAYCSAMPVAYSGLASALWEPFARLILKAAYESTLAVAALNAAKTGNKTVFLTLLGGGVFGNDQTWILDAIRRAATIYKNFGLAVKIVSFRQSNSAVRQLCDEFC